MSKILVIEDNPMLQEILQERLWLRNYEVFVAADGRNGIVTAKAEQPDVILMDVSLPIIDGWEATKQLKSLASTKDIPIIVLTAHTMEADKERSFAAGCDEFQSKPIDFKLLFKKIDLLLAMRCA